ncbi:MAG: tRNA pseudouridine(38-40) synthase TruA [Candidatus Obscuribacterales bacterium]|nr:tRNA pseudouridine(38-40) synthase TruA [Steroidobacteraceae bacterium]
MPRIALVLEYDGSAYRGWQSQPDAPSVQAEVERALSFVANHPVQVITAGRTDSGVHACMQVVHFDTTAERGSRAWILGSRSELPKDISVSWAKVVSDSFHARYSAIARSYRYLILNRTERPALERNRVCWTRRSLDAQRMHVAAQCLVGEHDFSSLRAAECQSHSPIRRLESIAVTRVGDYLAIDVTANAFLQHMVRNIAGMLLAIGVGDNPVEWAAAVLAARDRRLAGVTAPPQGLYLVGVRYPEEFALPIAPSSMWHSSGDLIATSGPRIDAAGLKSPVT